MCSSGDRGGSRRRPYDLRLDHHRSVADATEPNTSQGARSSCRGAARLATEERGGGAVRFTFAESMCDPSHYMPLAIEAERAGFDSFTVPDSICYPQESDSKYPYTAGRRSPLHRGQAVHRAVRVDGGARRGHGNAALHDLRREAADPAAGAGGEAGRVARRDDRRALRVRRRPFALAGGLRRRPEPSGRTAARAWTR